MAEQNHMHCIRIVEEYVSVCLAIMKHPTVANQFPREIKTILVVWKGRIICALFSSGQIENEHCVVRGSSTKPPERLYF